MEKEHIEGAKERARLVVDGMTKVKDQQARDVLKLIDHIELQNQVISRLETRIDELEIAHSSGDDFINNFMKTAGFNKND